MPHSKPKTFLLLSVDKYTGIVLLNFILIILSRIIEWILLACFQDANHLTAFEVIGTINDLCLFTIVLALLFPLYLILALTGHRFANLFFRLLTIIWWTTHFMILGYFVMEFKLLDVFLFQYPWKEIWLNLRFSGVNWWLWGTILLLPLMIVLTFKNRLKFPIAFRYYLYLLPVALSGLFILKVFALPKDFQNVAKNKPVYFYTQSLKLFFSEKRGSRFDINSIADYQKTFNTVHYLSQEYPYLHRTADSSMLGSYFTKSDTAPNIVILIVEGLSNKFVNPIHGLHFMPFLDSLKYQGLYWDHFLTTGERSFAVVPSLTGSLPYGIKGFTFLEPMPFHFNLVNVLHANGYFTDFFYGQGAWQHQKDRYFKQSGMDLIFDKNKFTKEYKKIITGSDSFFWGYNDKRLFDQYAEVADTLPRNKRFDIFFTGSTHPPFSIEQQAYYEKRFNHLIKGLPEETMNYFTTYQKYFLSLLFADDAIRSFFNFYNTKQDFSHTIFVITGDHPMSEIPPDNPLKRYHIPFIIYSPLLKQKAAFHGIGSHLDFYEPFTVMLRNNYGLRIPDYSGALSSIISTDPKLNMNYKVAFMNDNREIVDFMQNGYFLSGNHDIYKVKEGFELEKESDNRVKQNLEHSLELFKSVNLYASLNDKILPDSFFYQGLNRTIIYEKHIPLLSIDKAEYIDLISALVLPPKKTIVDIMFEFNSEADRNLPVGVYQLRNGNNKVVFWQSFQLTSKNKTFQTKINLEADILSQGKLKFDLFLWNQKKVRFELKNVKAFVSQEP